MIMCMYVYMHEIMKFASRLMTFESAQSASFATIGHMSFFFFEALRFSVDA